MGTYWLVANDLGFLKIPIASILMVVSVIAECNLLLQFVQIVIEPSVVDI